MVDPPRDGLGAAAAAVTACEPRAIAYVSCDPASLARDARLLAESGYRLDWAAPVDLFPQTYHVETVAAFVGLARPRPRPLVHPQQGLGAVVARPRCSSRRRYNS